MGQGFLIDTNVVIYALENKIPPKGAAFLAKLPPLISDVTRIELLGWPKATAEQLAPVKTFTAKARLLPIDEPVVLKTIALKQANKVKLGDAIIAATAIVHGLVLITRNTGDFQGMAGLELMDPFEL
jgi:predicted nucleic acid-binding protein